MARSDSPKGSRGRGRSSDAAMGAEDGVLPPRLALPIIRKTSVSLQAAEAIKALIVAGDLKAGELLPPERDLAAMLGISRPSLREGMKVLAALNVVEARQGGGTSLTSLHPQLLARPIDFLLQVKPKALLDLLELREVLEVAAARLAAPKVTEELLTGLWEDVHKAAGVVSQLVRFEELDFDVHTKVIEATGNPIYRSLYESVAALSLEGRRRTSTLADRREAHKDHVAIVTALGHHDGEGAARAMSAHLQRARRAIVKMLDGEG